MCFPVPLHSLQVSMPRNLSAPTSPWLAPKVKRSSGTSMQTANQQPVKIQNKIHRATTYPACVHMASWQRNNTFAAAEAQQRHRIGCARLHHDVAHGTALAQAAVAVKLVKQDGTPAAAKRGRYKAVRLTAQSTTDPDRCSRRSSSRMAHLQSWWTNRDC
jgi:hypothetical protein